MTVDVTAPTFDELLGHPALAELYERIPARWWHRSFGPELVERVRPLLPDRIASLAGRAGAQVRALGHASDGRPRAVLVRDEDDLVRRGSQGHSIFVDDGDWPALERLARSVDRSLGLPTGACEAKVSLSASGTGFPAHFDQYETFQLQLEGTKRWRLAAVTNVRFPLHPHLSGTTPSAELLEYAAAPMTMPAAGDTVTLAPGDVMFVPRGHWHATAADSPQSLSLVLRCATPAWLHLLDPERQPALVRDEAWREPAFFAWGEDERAARARARLACLLDGIGDRTGAEWLIARYRHG
jgi:ribosomal protein L16 Arg81 hydroxylase